MKVLTPRTTNNFKEFSHDIEKHEIYLLAASIAYTTALAIAPFILILLSIASLLGPDLQDELYVQISANVGDKAGEAIHQIIQNAKAHPTLSGLSGIFAFVVIVISSSAIFSQLRIALDKVNEHKTDKTKTGIKFFIKDKLFSVGLVFGFAFLSIVSLVASTFISTLFSGTEGLIWNAVSFVSNIILFTGLFTLIYRYIPSDRLPWKTCMISGLVSAVAYIVGKALISIYLGKASFESSYGAAGSLIAFLAWVYYTALTLLVSYEFSKDLVIGKKELSTRDRGNQLT